MKCSKCNAELPEIAKFCMLCGAEVIRERICKGCGHKLEENARFCMLCGTPADPVGGVTNSTATEKKEKLLNVGDIIPFGKNNRSWIVLDIKGDKALLLTQGAVEQRAYHHDLSRITWRDSDLYHWLNNEFLRSEFGTNELSQICTKQNGEKVFLLNTSEAEKYNEVLPILSTNKEYGYDDHWWVQTDIEPTNYVPFVRPYEKRVDTYGNGIAAYTSSVGVRIAMWIKV